MDISSVGSCSTTSVRSMYHQFRAGKKNLSEQNLQEAQSELEAAGRSTTQVEDLLANYDNIDTDGDGISAKELAAFKKLHGLDTEEGPDSDGKNVDELTTERDRIAAAGGDTEGLDKLIAGFTTADTDANGSLTREEFEAYADANGIEKPERPGRPMGPPPPPPGSETDSLLTDADSTSDDATSTQDSSTGSEAEDSSLGSLVELILRKYSQASFQPDVVSIMDDIQA